MGCNGSKPVQPQHAAGQKQLTSVSPQPYTSPTPQPASNPAKVAPISQQPLPTQQPQQSTQPQPALQRPVSTAPQSAQPTTLPASPGKRPTRLEPLPPLQQRQPLPPLQRPPSSNPTLASPTTLRNSSLLVVPGSPLVASSSTKRCDNDASHAATVHCADCDESFCTACDQQIHNRPKTKAHVRQLLPQNATVDQSSTSKPVAAAPPSPRTQAADLRRASSVTPNNTAQPNGAPTAARQTSARAAAGDSSSEESESESDDDGQAERREAAARRKAEKQARRERKAAKKAERQAERDAELQKAPTKFVAKDFSRPKTALASPGPLDRPKTAQGRDSTFTFEGNMPVTPRGGAQRLAPLTPHGKAGAAPPSRTQNAVRSSVIAPTGKQPPQSITGESVLNTIPTGQLKMLDAEGLNAIWQQYDTDGNGVLDRRELKLLATDCINRTLQMFEEEMRRVNPKISDSQLKKQIEKEKHFLLPGKSAEESHKEMVRMLTRKLDVNADGSVTKLELMTQWSAFSAELFNQRQAQALDCCIM